MKMRAAVLLLLVCAGTASAQEAAAGHKRVKVRATMSGSSDASADAYKIFSGIALEVAFGGDLSRSLALELALRTESREVEGPGVGSAAERLGSLEMLPATAILQWRPGWGGDSGFQPYLGAGLSANVFWEKSGALDSIDVPAHVGPALQLGFDQHLAAGAWLNIDVRWNTLRVDLTELDPGARKVKVDPLVFALGMAFDF